MLRRTLALLVLSLAVLALAVSPGCTEADPVSGTTTDGAAADVGEVDATVVLDSATVVDSAAGADTASPDTANECVTDSDCADDGDVCNGVPACTKGRCGLKAGSAVTCDTTSDGICSITQCNPKTGACVAKPQNSHAA